jgi:DNA-cytosine methyltransferase
MGGIVVVSLFDGAACGLTTLKALGIKVDAYYASEIDKYAMSVAKFNHPEIIHIGDVTKVTKDMLPRHIHLLIGGSPCQGFSFAGKNLNFDDPRSKLFFEFDRILVETEPAFFFMENVKMKRESEQVITKTLGVNPILINSSLVSAQSRARLYWTNIGAVHNSMFAEYMESTIPMPVERGLTLASILQQDVDVKYDVSSRFLEVSLKHKERHTCKGNGFGISVRNSTGKSFSVTTKEGMRQTSNFIKRKPLQLNPSKECMNKQPYQGNTIYDPNFISPCINTLGMTNISINDIIRRLTPIECERLQGLPDNYTKLGIDVNGNTVSISDTQRYKMLGNGWQIDTIKHMFQYLPWFTGVKTK